MSAAAVERLAAEASACRACPLWRDATQAVFGEGPAPARLMLVGEQPGDREDLAGRPFVGPAGRVLDDALHRAGIDRGEVYLTNAVKHFKFSLRGKRRIHQRPARSEVVACSRWLEAELAAVRPAVVVALGATAASAVVGRPVKVLTERGQPLATPLGPPAVATLHPSAVVRIRDRDEREEAMAGLVGDLAAALALAPAG